MRLKAFSTAGALSLAIIFSACGGAANTANVANKTGNAVSPNTTTTNPDSAAATTGGDMITIDAAGIQVAAPKGFKIEKDGETTNLISPDDMFEVYFHVPKDGDYNKAIDEVTTEIEDYIKDVKIVTKDEKGNFGGLDAMLFDGTGIDKEDGKPVNWELIVLDAPKKPVLIVSYGDKKTNEKYSKEIMEIGQSIRKQNY